MIDWPMSNEKVAALVSARPSSKGLPSDDIRSKGDMREWKTCDFGSPRSYIARAATMGLMYGRPLKLEDFG